MLDNVTATRSSSSVRDWMIASPVITPRTGVGTALRLLDEHGLPALPVVEGSQFRGVVRERDLLRLAPSEATTLDVYEQRAALDQLTVGRLVRPAERLNAGASLQEAMSLMGRTGLEAVPVLEDGHLVGMLVWPALMEALARAWPAPDIPSVPPVRRLSARQGAGACILYNAPQFFVAPAFAWSIDRAPVPWYSSLVHSDRRSIP